MYNSRFPVLLAISSCILTQLFINFAYLYYFSCTHRPTPIRAKRNTAINFLVPSPPSKNSSHNVTLPSSPACNSNSSAKPALRALERQIFNHIITPTVPPCVRLIVLIISAPEEFERRKVIRRTWAKTENLKASNAARIFLLGRSSRSNVSIALHRRESEEYEDILADASLLDTYYNLTLKVASGLYWVASQIWPQVRYVAKIDSDCFAKLEVLYDSCKQLTAKMGDQPWITGLVFTGRSTIVHRNPNDKWFVNISEYSDKNYPDYVNGPSYVFSIEAVRRILNLETLIELQIHKFFRFEDVYFTGILRQRLFITLVRVKNQEQLFRQDIGRNVKPLGRQNFIAVHKMPSDASINELQDAIDKDIEMR